MDSHDWVKRQKSLQASHRYMFDNQIHCDVHFMIEKKRLGAHKYMLCARSPVFFSMLSSSMKESESPDDINLEDSIVYEIFNKFLRFLYCEEVVLTQNDVMQVLDLANKYEVSSLINACIKFLIKKATPEDVCMLLEKNFYLSIPELTKSCMKYINENTAEVLKSKTFLSTTEETVQIILELEEINLPEVELFLGCVEWARHPSEKTSTGSEVEGKAIREKLQNLLPSIHFPAMSLQEFSNKVIPLQILTNEEALDVYQSLEPSTYFSKFFPFKKRFKCSLQLIHFDTGFTSHRDSGMNKYGTESGIISSLHTTSHHFKGTLNVNREVILRSLFFVFPPTKSWELKVIKLSILADNEEGRTITYMFTGKEASNQNLIGKISCDNVSGNTLFELSLYEMNETILCAGSCSFSYVVDTVCKLEGIIARRARQACMFSLNPRFKVPKDASNSTAFKGKLIVSYDGKPQPLYKVEIKVME